jgi:ribosomal protein S27E
MAGKAEYQLPTDARRRVLYGFDYLYARRDRHFGNGRTSRNSFERSVRRLANRLATLQEMNRELLTTLQPEDIEIAGIDDAHLAAMVAHQGHVRVQCDACKQELTIPDAQLSVAISCSKCGQSFTPQWGEPVVVQA